MQASALSVDIFYDDVEPENVADLTQDELDLITDLWLQDLDDNIVGSSGKGKAREIQTMHDNTTMVSDSSVFDLEDLRRGIQDQQLAQNMAWESSSDDGEGTKPVGQEEENKPMLVADEQEKTSAVVSPMADRSPEDKIPVGQPSGTSGSSTSLFGVPRALSSFTSKVYDYLFPTARCIVCDEDSRSFVRVPCKEIYCTSCLCELFEHAIKDESLMPPRCCRQEIPLHMVAPYLSGPKRIAFQLKLKEHNTLNRLYCIRPSCSAFLGSADGPRRPVSCPTCYTRVCSSCKKAAHSSWVPCTEDEATAKTIEFCQQQGWQRCPNCQRMIELSYGCYHMTCLCRTQFCYVCRALWKTCSCPQWDEDRLVEAARDRVREEIRRPPMPVQHVNRHWGEVVEHRLPVHRPNIPANPPAPRPNPAPFLPAQRPNIPPNAPPFVPRNPPAPRPNPAPVLPAQRPIIPPNPPPFVPRNPPPHINFFADPPGPRLDLLAPRPNPPPAPPVHLPNPTHTHTPDPRPANPSPTVRHPNTTLNRSITTPQPQVSNRSTGTIPRVLSPPPVASTSKVRDHPKPLVPVASTSKVKNQTKSHAKSTQGQRDFDARVRAMVEHLRENHACEHPGWYTHWGPFQCQVCFHRLDKFILRCRGCQMRACVRCRRNRL